MERIYHIHGLDCANCAAKLERRLKEILWFDSVVIDFMAQKLILSASDETAMETGVNEALKVIEQMEPGVTIAKKERKKKTRTEHEKKQEGTCGCGHEHHHVHETHVLQHEGTCSCSHEHHHVHETHVPQHEGTCSCGHDHHHVHEAHAPQHEGTCSCGHSHPHTHETHGDQNEAVPMHDAVTVKEVSQKIESRFTVEMKAELAKICVSAVLFVLAILQQNNAIVQLGMYLLAYLIVGAEVLLRAGKNIARGQVFDENFLMAIATIGAFFIGEYPEGVMVMLFYQLGELFQEYALHRSRCSIAELMDIKPEVAHVKDGERYLSMEPEAVIVGDVIQVRPGERIPLDGVVLEGHSALNTVALTGESLPRAVTVGDAVQSGCINTSGVLLIRVEKEYEDSTVAKILDLVENASSKKAETEKFITRFARYYTPIVVLVAAALAIIPPMLLQEPFGDWVYRALVFLVISCPCALVISVPLTYFCGLGVCSRQGILVKGSNYLETLAQMETAVFDKTGTLTKGAFSVTTVHAHNCTEEQLLYYAACVESISNHPIADAIGKANRQKIASDVLQEAEEFAGQGIKGILEGHCVLVGNAHLLSAHQVKYENVESADTVVYVAVDGVLYGYITIADQVKTDAKTLVMQLKKIGVNDIVMLTGDQAVTAELVAKQLGIAKVFSQLLPGDKVSCLEQILSRKSPNASVAFVGDGLNDAPVLARADVGIAMGGLGSDAAIEAADVVIMNDQPSKIVDAVQIARKTQRIVQQNIVFVLLIKFLVLLLGALGMATMWMAVFADVGVAFLAILNAVRILKYE